MGTILADPQKFILAGKAVVTLHSLKTDARFTYKINKIVTRKGPLWFVSLLRGQNNESDYSYIGTISEYHEAGYHGFRFRHTKKSKVKQDAPSFMAFSWTMNAIQKNADLSDKLEIFHEGRCGRCGRRLTVPESITSGYGPECIGKV